MTQNYVSFINEKKFEIEISFIKVPAHAGIKYNEEADSLAKSALLAKGHKTYNDGSVYFVGYGVEDWKSIVDHLNEENVGFSQSSDSGVGEITLSETIIESRTKIEIKQLGNKVVINCYGNNKSYVQGKQTALMTRVIATAIECLVNKEKVIEVLNCYHALTISQEEVENRFTELLPDYEFETEKNYSNLLSAVYNSMLTGFMPDYTCLVTPIFRAYEFYLHRILHDKMGIPTSKIKKDGTEVNIFSYFDKQPDKSYVCNRQEIASLSEVQKDFLNRLYTNYNSVRHPYSHWSLNDEDVAVITDIATARELLLDGLDDINNYYKLF